MSNQNISDSAIMKYFRQISSNMKVRFVLLDYDQTYLNRLSSSISTREDCSAEIYSFTEREKAFEKVREIGDCILVISDRFEVDDIPEGACLAWLTEKHSLREIKNQPAIYRYQKADNIFRDLLSVYSGTYTAGTDDNGTQTGRGVDVGLYAFCSCGGGSGASTAAAACAMRFASIGLVPLYINLERFGSSEVFFRSETKTHLGDLLYAIKSKRTNLSFRLKSSVTLSEEGVSFIESCKAATETMEMTSEDVCILLEKLREMEQFDCIIIDCDLLLEGSSLEIMRQSDSIVLVSNGERSSHKKLERIHAAMEIIAARDEVEFPRTWLLYNSFSSKSGSTDSSVDIAVLGGAPRYEGATQKRIAKQLSQMTFFDSLI